MSNFQQRSTVIGVFETRVQADSAIDELRRAGFRQDQIGVIARGTEGNVPTAIDESSGNLAAEGAMAGALAGAGVGGLVGLGVLAGVIPVIGPAIAAGTLGTILLNAAGGAALASVAGGLIGLGIPEEEASYYEGEIKSGRYLVTVNAAARYNEAWNILQRHGAYCREEKLDTIGEEALGAHPMPVEEQGLHPKEDSRLVEPVDRSDLSEGHRIMNIPVNREDVLSNTSGTLGRTPVPEKGHGGAPFAESEQSKEKP